VDSGSTASYVYNALGQRVSKTVGSTYRGMVYDAFGQLMEYNNGHAETQDLVWLGGRPIATYVAGTRFLHANALGSTLALTDHYGTYTQDAVYDAWGNLWAWSGTMEDQRFASLGKRDAETGLDPTWARLYSSTQMRWLSPDPLAGDITNPQSLNRYAYVLNNPTTLIDPLGLGPDNCSDLQYFISHAGCGGPPPCVAYGTEGCIVPPEPYPPPYPPGGGGGGGGSAGGTPPGTPPVATPPPAPGGVPGGAIGGSFPTGEGFLSGEDVLTQVWPYSPWIIRVLVTACASDPVGCAVAAGAGAVAGVAVFGVSYGGYQLYKYLTARPVPAHASTTGSDFMDAVQQFIKDLKACEQQYPPGPDRDECIKQAKIKYRFRTKPVGGKVQ
jgi:RHS repeat-associated protein